MIQKADVLKAILSLLETELATIVRVAKAAHEEATHEESKAEDQYDTRGLEASYLAGAQAQRAQELESQLASIRTISSQENPPNRAIAPGALVELISSGSSQWVLLAARGGGVQVTVSGVAVRVISLQSPLGEELLGRRVGEEFEIESQGGGTRAYVVKQVK